MKSLKFTAHSEILYNQRMLLQIHSSFENTIQSAHAIQISIFSLTLAGSILAPSYLLRFKKKLYGY